jgi:diketogulonate reductase-like aldo/keto reductase
VAKADNADYITEDMDVFSWSLTAAEMAKLDAADAPSNSPSWGCTA